MSRTRLHPIGALAMALALLVGAASAVVVLAASGSTAAQTPVPAPTFRTRSEGVRVDVLVTDGERPVDGLTAKDFVLLDSGVRQDVEVSSVADSPLDVILVLDTSTSLGADGLRHLVRAADTLFSRLKPADRAALVTFSEDVTLRAALTPQHARVRTMLQGLEIRGTTSVIDATYTGMIVQSDAVRPTMLLVFTDGIDTASWLDPERVLDTARRAAVVPYAVVTGGASPVRTPTEREAFGASPASSIWSSPRRPTLPSARQAARGPRDPEEAFAFVGDLVRAGGGLLLDADSPRRFEERFEQALDSFRRRYILTYTPRDVERQGWHQVEIRIEGRRHRVRARPGYFVQ